MGKKNSIYDIAAHSDAPLQNSYKAPFVIQKNTFLISLNIFKKQ